MRYDVMHVMSSAPIINTAPTAVLVPNFSPRNNPENAVAVRGSKVYIKVVSAELTVID